MTLQKIEFMYEIPEGYRFVRYGKLIKGCENINAFGAVSIAECDQIMERIVVEKIPKQERPSHNTKRRKHADLIHAWAEGAEIQFQRQDKSWGDVVYNIPNWGHEEIYRIKPKTKTVRFGNFIHTLGFVSSTDCDISDRDYFKKWLGDWQEVEIEEND